MFKRMKLGTKIGTGFVLLIAITSVLGGLAIVNMRGVQQGARTLSDEYVAEVGLVMELERAVQQTMYEIRGYGFTEDPSYLQAGRANLQEVERQIAASEQLAAASPHLVKLPEALRQVQGSVDQYEQLVEQTVQRNTSMAARRQVLDQAATAYMAQAAEFLAGQNEQMRDEIDAGAEPAQLEERLRKIALVNEAIDLGNEVRVACFKSQAMRDPELIRQADARFPGILAKIAELRTVTHQAQNLAQLDAIEAAGKSYREAMNGLLADWLAAQEIGTKRTDAGMAVLAETKGLAERGIDETTNIAGESVATLTRASVTMIVGLAVALAVGVLLAVVITRLITKPIHATLSMIKDIATGEGDLTKRVAVTSQDECGQLAEWFNRFVDQLHGMIVNVAGAADDVAAAATEISATNEQMSTGAQQQTAQTSEVATAVEQMSATVMEVAKNAGTAAESAKQSLSTANEGGAVVERTVEGIQAISRSTDEATATIGELGKASEQIGQIIGVINDIADQTNLLALNAAIEAARAGEHGRGFAVVADEVRKLAERTGEATKEVGATIRAIQEKTGSAVTAMNDGNQQVRNGVELANQAGEALQSIVANATSISQVIQQIAAAAEEQSSASEQISRNIESISSVTTQTAASVQQAAAASQQLARRASELQGMVGRFKIDRSKATQSAAA